MEKPELDITCFENFPVLETRRLILRQVKPSDASAIFDMRSNPRNFEYTPKSPLASLEQAKELVTSMHEGYVQKTMLPWGLEIKETGELIGAFGLLNVDTHSSKAELGGELNLSHWGRHLATEACMAIGNFAFEKMNLHRLYAQVNPNNKSVIYYLEKFGFEKEAHHKDFAFIKGAYWDLVVYTMLNPSH